MVDHQTRIAAKAVTDAEEAAVAHLETCCTPLMLSILLAVVVLVGAEVLDSYADRRYLANSQALADCLNGQTVDLGDNTAVSCKITKLVGGVK